MYQTEDVLTPEFLQQGSDALKATISGCYGLDESEWLSHLMALAEPSSEEMSAVSARAARLIEQVRSRDDAILMIDALLLQYSLDTREGILLMCLAEALMRVPDAQTADALIRDKLSVADWEQYLRKSESLLVNASTWGLMLTGKVVTMDASVDGSPAGVINRLVNRLGEPVIRKAMHQAMKIMGKHFVLGRTIQEALKHAREYQEKGYTYSFDMLGEAALTARDASLYYDAYAQAIETISNSQNNDGNVPSPTISIKLSALHPRYEVSQEKRVMTELFDALLALLQKARASNVGITIDAEEADRLELSLNLFEKLYRHPSLAGWNQFGLVVQAYSKRALPVLCWMAALAREVGDCIPVRLVKGAYWDSEIKLAQQLGLSNYPVFTRKEATDVSYLACARFLLNDNVSGLLYPQFATHNAHTVASILTMASHRQFEFQRLHGMGDALYNTLMEQEPVTVRIYAPVGSHQNLLPYLVRRLLENGANTSFVHRLVDAKTPVADLVKHPVTVLRGHASLANERIPLPPYIFGDSRLNSAGINIHIESQWQPFQAGVSDYLQTVYSATPIINGQRVMSGHCHAVQCPYQLQEKVGEIYWADTQNVQQAIEVAASAFPAWSNRPVDERAVCLERLADLLESHQQELVALCHREAGKTIQDSIDEIREAVDFCRYYALQARERFTVSAMTGPTGELDELYLTGRGVFACISPWNFPLAIFLGQITAALVAGNTVIAKPAEQTGLVAWRAVQLMLEAGVPEDVIQFLPGDGYTVGAALVADERVAGVAFTGSTDTAKQINRSLAAREGGIATLVAETGGQNAMIVDSTALPEQVVIDVVHSAFTSAGQRCSALRVLYLQQDVADRMIDLLKGAMSELAVGNPVLHETDIGPVIDAEARDQLQAHVNSMKASAVLLAETPLAADCHNGCFLAPVAFEIQSIKELDKEHFGPVLHVIRYAASELDRVIDEINETGFGLTLGIHTRNEATAAYIDRRVRAGNVYINRNQIGAVVGVQPFGGQGLSGTGPKAGGPHYLLRFVTERTRSTNTTAVGGNATLLSLGAGG
ncbi:bifunctional proline dehydrogenase/L-glutamate gamma-semialdehyde dehydrogenase PutA [Kistimonas asteriae]|uniref:bifunctional proline dehydrogenase/L-glutamate gamma-semialdehyde dehydrogenase PutA n=1 Tax=Kistimonas asteriae TaxID=517724 RepID=UPI001BACDCB4|nr:bifunctional proline dehydrogenase/L-glutamate gamma-semialdehyde dehydrogenase PutA [Kistimonas asteriae]